MERSSSAKGPMTESMRLAIGESHAWSGGPIAQQPGAQLPWDHISVDKQLDPATRTGTPCLPSNTAGPQTFAEHDREQDPRTFRSRPLQLCATACCARLRARTTDRQRPYRFEFLGRQAHFDFGGDDLYIDLLFFHVEQLGYIVSNSRNSSQSTPANSTSISPSSMIVYAARPTPKPSESSSAAARTTTPSATASVGPPHQWP